MKSAAYGSSNIPKKLFPDDEDYKVYNKLMQKYFPGLMAVRQEFLDMWNVDAIFHTCTMPDGHTWHVPVTEKIEGEEARIQIDEVAPYNNGRPKTVTFIHEQQKPSTYNIPILANLTQGLDGWMVRMVRMSCYAEGIEIVTIHDGFRAHPNHMGRVRHWYREHLAQLAESNYLEQLIHEITGEQVSIRKMSDDLPTLIRNSTYLLS